jgi:hypothetical protein
MNSEGVRPERHSNFYNRSSTPPLSQRMHALKSKMNSPANEIDNGLVFVNISRPNDIKSRDTQQIIRRRVMRDIGRSRRSRTTRRPPTWELTLDLPTPGSYKHSATFLAADSSPPTSWTISPTIPSSLDPCNSAFYPFTMDSRGLQLIHFSM